MRFSKIVTTMVFLGAMVALTNPALAQAIQIPQVGAEAGVNINNASLGGDFGNNVESSTKAGLAIGASVLVAFKNPMWAVQTGVLYMQRGIGFKGKGDSTGFTANLAYDAVEIPVLLRITPMPMKPYYIVVGPGFNFTTTAKLTDQKFNGQITDPDEDLKQRDQVESAVYSFIVGGGYTWNNFDAEVRYDGGMNNLIKQQSGDNDSLKPWAITILGRYNFKLKK